MADKHGRTPLPTQPVTPTIETYKFWVRSIVAARDKQGYVHLFFKHPGIEEPARDAKPDAQLSIAEAIDVGQNIIQAAESARFDAYLIHWLMLRFNIGYEQALMSMHDFRGFRVNEKLVERARAPKA
jgi:hypothetical protein